MYALVMPNAGFSLNDGSDNSIVGNICLNNSAGKPGAYPGILLQNVNGMTVSANRCVDDRQAPAQSFGIEETGSIDVNLVMGNHCRGNVGGGIRLIGKASLAFGNHERVCVSRLTAGRTEVAFLCMEEYVVGSSQA